MQLTLDHRAHLAPTSLGRRLAATVATLDALGAALFAAFGYYRD